MTNSRAKFVPRSNAQAQQRQANRYLPTNSRRWRSIRATHLSMEPLCRHCLALGRVTPATEVDHINGRADRAEDYEPDNLQSLCERCHSRKTRLAQAAAAGLQVDDVGCDADGNPTDPDHPWNSS